MLKVTRNDVIEGWNAEFQNHAGELGPLSGSVKPLDPKTDSTEKHYREKVTNVWVELPRYGGIVIAVETSEGRILSPWYDQDPYDGYDEHGNYRDDHPSDLAFAENAPDEYLNMMLGATEYYTWTSYPTTGIRFFG